MEKLWIARDKNGSLFLYNKKPTKLTDMFISGGHGFHTIIDSELFPEVTWENSPQQVELKLIKNDSNS